MALTLRKGGGEASAPASMISTTASTTAPVVEFSPPTDLVTRAIENVQQANKTLAENVAHAREVLKQRESDLIGQIEEIAAARAQLDAINGTVEKQSFQAPLPPAPSERKSPKKRRRTTRKTASNHKQTIIHGTGAGRYVATWFENYVIDLLHANGPLTVMQLAPKTGYSESAVRYAVNLMRDSGLVERVPGTGTAKNGSGHTSKYNPAVYRLTAKGAKQ